MSLEDLSDQNQSQRSQVAWRFECVRPIEADAHAVAKTLIEQGLLAKVTPASFKGSEGPFVAFQVHYATPPRDSE
ncbi:hypothetical protein K2X83_02855 [Patescibacteria group bacterium]|nr:hypothetical protein [Patescibacteria group bacterium]